MPPAAVIKINAVVGSNDDLPIATLVQLDNQNAGGEITYAWQLLDQPPGAADALSNAAIQNPTFTPNKEGTYLIQLIVNQGTGTEVRNKVVAAVRQLKTRERQPAAGEDVQDSGAEGWSLAANSLYRRVDSLAADSGIQIGIANTGGLLRGQVLKCVGVTKIKTGLPGEESLSAWALAHANVAGDLIGLLGVLENGVVGNSNTPANGAIIRVRIFGLFGPITDAGGVGAQIWLTDAGGLASAAGTNPKRLGTVASQVAGQAMVMFSGGTLQQV